MDYSKALELGGYKDVSVHGNTYEGIVWHKEPDEMPTDNDLKKIYKDSLYIGKRVSEYPDIRDQLDAIWKELNYRRLNGDNLVSDADEMLGKILSIKKKYPKPK